jgi:hypothetical protein
VSLLEPSISLFRRGTVELVLLDPSLHFLGTLAAEPETGQVEAELLLRVFALLEAVVVLNQGFILLASPGLSLGRCRHNWFRELLLGVWVVL